MNVDGFEIERKFLIAMPAEELLENCDFSLISQTYLVGDRDTTERVRKRCRGQNCEYTHTVKRRVSSMRRREDERVIDAAEYEELLLRADPERRTIEKKRCCLEYGGELFEIDVFPFWKDRAILEIELRDETQRVELPPGVRLIREVTDDPRYTNSSLAKEIPEDGI